MYDQRQPEPSDRPDQAQRVLPRLDPPDREHERVLAPSLAERLGRGRAERRPHAVGHDADPVARRRRRAGRAGRPRPASWAGRRRPGRAARAARTGSGAIERRRHQAARPDGLPRQARLERRDRAGLVPADRREHHRDARAPRQPGQLEPLARHPEEVEQPAPTRAGRSTARTAGPERPCDSRCRPVWTSWFSPPPGAWNATAGACRKTAPAGQSPPAPRRPATRRPTAAMIVRLGRCSSCARPPLA